MRKQYIILLIIVGLMGIIGLIVYSIYANPPQKVTINFDADGAMLNLYKSKDGTMEKQGGVIRTIKQNESFTLAKGTYVIEADGTNITANPTILTVGNGDVMQTIPVSYTSSYLDQLLDRESPAIVQSLSSTFKNLSALYTIEPGKLYHKGEWYATALTYKGSGTDNRDTLHVILQKLSGTWDVVTKPPQISLSATDYKDIPIEILKDVNQYRSAPSAAPAQPAPTYIINDGSPGAR